MNNTSKDYAYYNKMHKIGIWITVISLALFCGVPLIICLVYDIMPTFSEVMLAAGGLCAIFIPTGLAEMFAEVPVMGSSYYVSNVTGNILNLKLPAALNALKVVDVKAGTAMSDAITGLAVSVSSLVTLVLLAIGAALLTPLQPLLSRPEAAVAAGNVLPALFGCLMLGSLSNDLGSGVTSKNRLLAAVLPYIICIVLFMAIPDVYSLWQGFVMILCIPVVYILTKVLYKKGIIKVFLPGEKEGKADND